MKQVKQSSWTTRHRDEKGTSRADRRRRGERGPRVLPPAPKIARPEPPPPVSAWCLWRRKLTVFLLGLLMLALFFGLMYAFSKHRPDPASDFVSMLKGYQLFSGLNEGPLERLKLDVGAVILGFLHAVGLPACAIAAYYLRPKRYDHWFEGEQGIGESLLGMAGTGLICLSCVLMMYCTYVALVDWLWNGLGGHVVRHWSIPSARSAKRMSSLASSYRSGQNFALVFMIGVLLAGGAVLRKRR